MRLLRLLIESRISAQAGSDYLYNNKIIWNLMNGTSKIYNLSPSTRHPKAKHSPTLQYFQLLLIFLGLISWQLTKVYLICPIGCYTMFGDHNKQLLKIMSKKIPYAQETREEISKSNLNESTAKILWTFSKRKRFIQKKPVCPVASYNIDLSTNSKRQAGFGSSKRKVFTEVTAGPCSWKYEPHKAEGYRNDTAFGLARENCTANSYLSFSVYKNPGPGQYNGASQQKKRGFSMRPKTAHQKTYFIDNKQLKEVPGPFQYNIITSREGVASLSKYKTATLGMALQAKKDRFRDSSNLTPSPSLYHPIKFGINKFSKNGKMGNSARKSFIDDVTRSEFTPGPGNYRMPTEFGHYSNYRHSRLSVS